MSFCLNPQSSDFIPPFSLHDPNVRMRPPPHLSFCLSHSAYQHKRSSTEGHQYFHCIQTASFTAFFFTPGKSLGAFHVVLLPVGYGNMKDFRLTFYKRKKKVSSTCNTDDRFYCIYVEKQIVLGGCFVNHDNRMDTFFYYKPGRM